MNKGGNMTVAEIPIEFSEAERTDLIFSGHPIEVHSALPGTRIDILPELDHPEDFHGSRLVDHVVRFGGTFEGLIGRYNGQFGDWDPDQLLSLDIVVLEHYHDDARQLATTINTLAKRFIEDPNVYDDLGACQEYFLLAQAGYKLLRDYEKDNGFDMRDTTPVSLERAGLVSTRLAFGLQKNAFVPSEVRVVTKRTHLKDEPVTHLTATVSWREAALLPYAIGNQPLTIADFVNPASGASVAAFVAAASTLGIKPASIDHRSLFLTRQGALFMKETLSALGIPSTYYSLGECDQLNEHYYLIGKPVGDAGHALRHFLPESYTQ